MFGGKPWLQSDPSTYHVRDQDEEKEHETVSQILEHKPAVTPRPAVTTSVSKTAPSAKLPAVLEKLVCHSWNIQCSFSRLIQRSSSSPRAAAHASLDRMYIPPYEPFDKSRIPSNYFAIKPPSKQIFAHLRHMVADDATDPAPLKRSPTVRFAAGKRIEALRRSPEELSSPITKLQSPRFADCFEVGVDGSVIYF